MAVGADDYLFDERVACVTDTVAVRVPLVGVVDCSAVVEAIDDAVAIAVGDEACWRRYCTARCEYSG